MWFMVLLSWLAFVVQLCFLTLAIAAGLYYLAELVEEYTTMTGKILKYLIVISTCVYVGLLLFEDLPFSLIALGLLSNGVYYLMLNTFPVIEFTSPTFLAGIALLFINHYLAFSHFATVWYPFSEVLGFFTICLWLVPFGYFVSLSANENVLPTISDKTERDETTDEGDIVTSYFKRKSKKIGLLSFLKSAQETILPQRVKKSY
ncbi:protein TEX261 [Lingula anatina]|uniref:Protein TEX261 n=1 Tax=Lingula anatina TaxID=7574 RepID=A0A1S3KEY5_LINAN|nr:protein TEX261 [Lingula anatina]|eukprot:XP_013420801.1 protein TEX261 [Lingula anatina]